MGTYGTGGGGDFLARKIYATPERVIVETNALKLHEKQTPQFTVRWEIIRRSLSSRILDFSGFEGKKLWIWISDFKCGNNFSWISCTVLILKVTKMDSIWSLSLHCLQPISLKFSNVKRRMNFCWIFVGGSLFSRDLIIADQWNIFEIRDIRSHVNFIPHDYLLKNSYFFWNIAYSIY